MPTARICTREAPDVVLAAPTRKLMTVRFVLAAAQWITWLIDLQGQETSKSRAQISGALPHPMEQGPQYWKPSRPHCPICRLTAFSAGSARAARPGRHSRCSKRATAALRGGRRGLRRAAAARHGVRSGRPPRRHGYGKPDIRGARSLWRGADDIVELPQGLRLRAGHRGASVVRVIVIIEDFLMGVMSSSPEMHLSVRVDHGESMRSSATSGPERAVHRDLSYLAPVSFTLSARKGFLPNSAKRR